MKTVSFSRWSIGASLISIIVGACAEFYDVAQGTGTWWNGFAFSWAIFFTIFCSTCLGLSVGGIYLVTNHRASLALTGTWFKFRERLGLGRWLAVLIIGSVPIWIFQVSAWGIVFQGFFIRILVWLLTVFSLTILISSKDKLFEWQSLLAIIVLTAGIFAIVATLRDVTSYPFSLGWSEGNRLWDYSILFGRERYLYPPDEKIFVLLSPGRQFIGGLPFLFSGNNILTQRLWVSLIEIIPYLLFGMALFVSKNNHWKQSLLLVIWTYLFLSQGPIHPPLVLSAFLIALAWRSPLWVALPLVVVSGGFASISRYTWMFAPAIWIFTLELSKVSQQGAERPWRRVFILSIAALVAGVLLPEIYSLLQTTAPSLQSIVWNSNVNPENIQDKISRQALLWYRLLPNRTYSPGIVLGLTMVIAPLTWLIHHLYRIGVWKITNLHKFALGAASLAFLTVGLIVSAKIGGGADLHNMDMLLITLAFITTIIWNAGGKDWLLRSSQETFQIKLVLIALLFIPALTPLRQMRSLDHYDLSAWLVALTDVNSARALDLTPPQDIVTNSLESMQANIQLAQQKGEILFVDQRQLLTFGYIKSVPLVPEYDKKVLIERAFTQNREYFNKFYSDLANKRFSLIIIQPLTRELQGSTDQFSEENNTWVTWVTKPLLCYYDIKLTLWEVNVQLLTPRSETLNCSSQLP